MGRIKLPVYFDGGFQSIADEAQRRDPDFAHYWVKRGPENEQSRRMMGYEPVEDKEILDRLGILNLAQNDLNRARWMDVELWRMPKELNDAIHEAQAEEMADRTASIRAALDAAGAEAAGRSGGTVRPFINTGGQDDIVTRQPVAAPSPGKEK